MRTTLLCMAALSLIACQATKEPKPEPEPRRIQLPDDARISIGVDDQERVKLSVTIPQGHPHPGTYTSTSPYLLESFKDAMGNIGKPGVAVWITVDVKNEILSMTNQVTMQ